MSEQPIKKMMIIVSKGTFNEAYQALVLANGALMEGIKAELFFTFDGLSSISNSPDRAPKADQSISASLQAQDMPGIGGFISQIKEAGGKVYGCKLSIDMLNINTSELRDDLDGVLSVGEFYDRAVEGSQVIYI